MNYNGFFIFLPTIFSAIYCADFKVTVHTADVYLAGTDGEIGIQFVNGLLVSSFYNLDKPQTYKDCERNKTDVFMIHGPAFDQITGITLAFFPRGPTPEWLVDYVHVEMPRGRIYRFKLNQWFNVTTKQHFPVRN